MTRRRAHFEDVRRKELKHTIVEYTCPLVEIGGALWHVGQFGAVLT